MEELTKGRHMLSGIGNAVVKAGWDEDTDAVVFCIDDELWAMYVDPEDGFRSYSCIHRLGDVPTTSMTSFSPQPVEISFKNVKTSDDYGWTTENKTSIFVRDAVNGKTVVEIGTDNTDDYYPVGYFHYHPENLEINKDRG